MATYFLNIDTMKYWNKETKTWVDDPKQATDFGHGKIGKDVKPAHSVRVRG